MEDLLRHTLATVAYRGGKALRGAPAEFGDYQASPGGRTPVEILAHMGDLFDWALNLADGKHEWHSARPLPGTRRSRDFSSLWRHSTSAWRPARRWASPRRSCFKAPLRTLSHTSDRLPCSAAWQAVGYAARITSRL